MKNKHLIHVNRHQNGEVIHEPFRSAQFRPWKHIFQNLREFQYSISSNHYSIEIDWNPIKPLVAWSEKLSKIVRPIEDGDTSDERRSALQEHISAIPERPNALEVEISANEFQEDEDSFRVLRKFFYDLQTLMNISCPGCADFSGWVFEDVSHSELKFQESFNGSNIMLDYVAADPGARNIADVSTLPLSRVIEWYRHVTLEMDIDYVATKGTAASLFALINATKYGSGDPEALLWIAHALEALYLPDRQGGLSILSKRINIFLQLDRDSGAKVKKSLQSFYNLRHSFVHGDSLILHPVHDYSSNKKIDSIIEKHDQPILLATSIVISTLQRMIRNGYSEILFHERFAGRRVFR